MAACSLSSYCPPQPYPYTLSTPVQSRSKLCRLCGGPTQRLPGLGGTSSRDLEGQATGKESPLVTLPALADSMERFPKTRVLPLREPETFYQNQDKREQMDTGQMMG